MKRIFLTLIFCISLCCAISARNNLLTLQIFDGRYRNMPDATETLISGKKLNPYNLSKYHSISIKNNNAVADNIEQLILKDSKYIIDKEVTFRKGKLYYGFYTFVPINNINRYLFFLNQPAGDKTSDNKVTVIYMEGKASIEQIKNLINK